MPFSVWGLSTAVPEHRMSRDEAIGMSQQCVSHTSRQDRILRTLFTKCGIENRFLSVPHEIAYRWVPVAPRELAVEDRELPRGPTTAERMQLYAQHAAPLAVRAAGRAMEQSGVASREITHLVTVSCTGFHAPGVDIELIEQLSLRPTVERVHIGFMGCHGAINAMRTASGLVAEAPAARVLISATELCSLHFCFNWDPERLMGNALFADGSAALVCGPADNSTGDRWRMAATGSCLIPASKDAITWKLGDRGFEMSLSNEVPALIGRHLRPWLEAWLDGHDLAVADVGSWAVHPGGPRIVDSVEEALGLPDHTTDVSRDVLRGHGNMSSPTVLFILQRLRDTGAPRPCVALGFGPGLVAEAALFL